MCCNTATINSLQATIDTWTNEIIVKAAARDIWLQTIRADETKGLPSFKTALATLQTNAVAATAIMTAATSGNSPVTDSTRLSDIATLKAAVAPYTTISSDVNDNVDSKWTSYETTRATCMDALLKAQASLYCASCSADYNTQGINNAAPTNTIPAVNLATSFKTAISGSCQPFLAQAQIQNQLVQAYAYRATLATLSGKLAAITDATIRSTSSGDTQTTVFTGFTAESLTEDEEEPLVALTTTTCTSSTDCAFVYDTLLSRGGVLNRDYAANGGQITVDTSSRRVLPEAESRTLAIGSGTLDPSAITSGVAVDFPEDAIAAVNSGFRQGGLMTCFVALIAAFLF